MNELTTLSRSGDTTVAGALAGVATNVTVKDNSNTAEPATVYSDNSFARENVALLNGDNTFTAIAEDAYGRKDTNTVTAWIPASATCYYDLRGNLTNDGRRVFYYDDENQLTTVLVSNAWKSEFAYDGLMRRRVRKEFAWSGGTWLQTNEVRYIYDGRVVLQERFYVPAGSTLIPQNTVTYTRGTDLSGTLQGAGGIGGLLARSDTSTLNPQLSTAFYHCDGNGNVTALIDTNQVLVAQYHFDPYGNILGMSGPLAEANLYRFSSKEIHQTSGLVYYLYRYYDPSLQRWINRDPIEERGGWNLFTHSANTPIGYIDNWGNNLGFGYYGGCGPAPYTVGPGGAVFKETTIGPTRPLSDGRLTQEYNDIYWRLQHAHKPEIHFDTYFWGGFNYEDYWTYDGKKYRGNEVNYIGIGMYEAWLGHSLETAKWRVIFWKQLAYADPDLPSDAELFWLEKGYNAFYSTSYYYSGNGCSIVNSWPASLEIKALPKQR